MSIQELEQAVTQLPPEELAAFAEWFASYHQDEWDKEIEEDYKSGRLNGLIEEANREFDAGRCRAL